MVTHTLVVNVRDRELDIVKMLADGNTIGEIAQKTNTNRRTLETKISALKRKYCGTTLPNLVAIFLRNKLID